MARSHKSIFCMQLTAINKLTLLSSFLSLSFVLGRKIYLVNRKGSAALVCLFLLILIQISQVF